MISGALAILKSEAQRNKMSAVYEKNKSLFLSIAYQLLTGWLNAILLKNTRCAEY